MPVTVHKKFFAGRAEVLDDVRASGFWPTTFVQGQSPGLDVHWHAEEVHAYVMDGETSVLDAESGERIAVGAGDKIVVPPRTLHAEGEVRERVVYIIAVPEPVPPDRFLVLRPPQEL